MDTMHKINFIANKIMELRLQKPYGMNTSEIKRLEAKLAELWNQRRQELAGKYEDWD